ncbi:MAG: phosphate acyltransferase PlsX [Planctomycetes bacterium]|nr:phosphate acyltransferase PlsX [Planctomycetota bacterium]MCH9728002.1 phosphate acyltransferase PlsX [Planctomycetota bacterium]MCH9775804.1 phosphate acyltransferase PlsX [Planctomycetota bacterium]MCH9789420.1 phosphate acyltransferase PlsX [Planctomycetota bacterium]
MRIALDAMGGDTAPKPNIEGAIVALQADPALCVTLVGPQDQIEAEIEASGYQGDRLSVAHASQVVGMEEKPTEAMRQKPDSSISICWKLMAAREVDAIVSAGNTGAVVASGLKTRLFLKSVKRPGIAVTLPTTAGHAVLMDVGANPSARPSHLYQYAVMGEIYAREVLHIESPKIGLINIGSEDVKGNDLYRETFQLLNESPLKDSFVGNVEGRGLYQGEADVLICEGFVGNVVLKVSEGMADFLMQAASKHILGSLDVEQNQAKQAFQDLGKRFRYHETGGAPLLGIDGICIICHGSSDAHSISNALRGSAMFKDRGINSQIAEHLAQKPVA